MSTIFYHISEMYLGNTVSMSPRIPINQMTKIFGEDSVTPRICVGRTIDNCLTAIGYDLLGKKLFVYEIEIDVEEELGNFGMKYPTAKEVPDVATHHEVWLLKNSTFRLSDFETIDVVDLRTVYTSDGNQKYILWEWHWSQEKRAV